MNTLKYHKVYNCYKNKLWSQFNGHGKKLNVRPFLNVSKCFKSLGYVTALTVDYDIKI